MGPPAFGNVPIGYPNDGVNPFSGKPTTNGVGGGGGDLLGGDLLGGGPPADDEGDGDDDFYSKAPA